MKDQNKKPESLPNKKPPISKKAPTPREEPKDSFQSKLMELKKKFNN
jgi:hypothetical protein